MEYDDFPHGKLKDVEIIINGADRTLDVRKVEIGTMSSGQDSCVITFNNKGRLNIYVETMKSSYPSYAVWTKSDVHGLTISGCPRWRRRCGKCTIIIWEYEPPKIDISIGFCCHSKNQVLPNAPYNIRIQIRPKAKIKDPDDSVDPMKVKIK